MNSPTWNTQRLIEQDIAHHFHPATNLHRHKQSGPLVLFEGKGSKVRDSQGWWYIDSFAGLWNVNVGYGHTELAEVAREQVARLAFQPTFFGLARCCAWSCRSIWPTRYKEPVTRTKAPSCWAAPTA